MSIPAYGFLHQAIIFASKRHKNLDRDGEHPLPYVTHCIEVMSNLRYLEGITDEVILCAAMLHDILEWSDTKESEVKRKFGDSVTRLVKELTRQEPTKKQIQGFSDEEVWLLRHHLLMEDIERMSPKAQSIKLSDRLSNLLEEIRVEKKKNKLSRYFWQTYQVLDRITKGTCPVLWECIREKLPTRNQIDWSP